MLLDSQKQFVEDYLRPLYHGEKVTMPPGYAELYQEWSMAYGDALNKWSPEERGISFAEYLDDRIHDKITKLIPNENLVDAKNHKLADRGRVVLASKDGGKTFDQLLKPEDLQQVDPKDYVFLSSDMRNTTTDLAEIMNEQVLIRVQKNLKDQNFLIENAYIREGIINVEVKNQKGESYSVQVDPKQKFDKPLNYIFINARGVAKVVLETQLPEAFGSIETDFVNFSAMDLDRKKMLLGAAGAGLVGVIPPHAQPRTYTGETTVNIPGRSVVPNTNSRIELPSKVDVGGTMNNIIEAKAKLEQDKKKEEEDKKIAEERREKYDEDLRKKRLETEQAKAEQNVEQKRTRNKSNITRAFLAGAGMGGAVATGLGAGIGGTLFINLFVK